MGELLPLSVTTSSFRTCSAQQAAQDSPCSPNAHLHAAAGCTSLRAEGLWLPEVIATSAGDPRRDATGPTAPQLPVGGGGGAAEGRAGVGSGAEEGRAGAGKGRAGAD